MHFLGKILFSALLLNTCLVGYSQSPRLVLPLGHTHGLQSVAFSPDGKLAVTGSRKVKVWEVATGKELHSLEKYRGMVSSVAFSSDGKQLVFGAGTGIKFWRVNSDEGVTDLEGHIPFHFRDALCLNANLALTGGLSVYDDTTRLWDITTGRQLLTLNLGYVYSSSLSPDGTLALTGTHDEAILWEVSTGQKLYILKHEDIRGGIEAVAFSPDGKLAAMGSSAGIVKVWQVATGKELLSFESHGFRLVSMSFSSNGLIALVGYDTGNRRGKLMVIEVSSGEVIFNSIAHNDAIISTAFSPDGQLLLTGSLDETAKIWDVSTGEAIHILSGYTDRIYATAISPNGKMILNGSEEGVPELWETTTGRKLFSFKGHSEKVEIVAFSPDNKVILTSSEKESKLWQVTSGRELYTLKESHYVTSAVFSQNGQAILIGCSDGEVKLWDVNTGQYILSYDGLLETEEDVVSMAFSPDSKLAVVAIYGGAILFEVATGNELFRMKGHLEEEYYLVTFSPDGRLILMGSGEETVLWDVATGEELYTLAERVDEDYMPIAFSQDSKYILIGSEKEVKLWDVASGQYLFSNDVNIGWTSSVAFSPNSKLMASGSDKTAILWDVATGKELYRIEGHSGYITSLTFSTNGEVIITSSDDNVIYFWDTATGKHLYSRVQLTEGDWLVYDEHYRFDGSERARELLYFTCGLEVIELNQLKDQLYVPGLAEKIMAGDSLEGFPKLSDLDICGVTPLVEDITADTPESYHYSITSRKGGLSAVEVYINDQRTFTYQPEDLIAMDTAYELSLTQEQLQPYLVSGVDNPIRILGLTEPSPDGSTLKSRGAEVVINNEDKKEPPDLYAVMVGVSDYKDDELDLNYSAKDALDLGKVLELSSEKLLNDDVDRVHVYSLISGKTNAEPLRKNIKNTIAEIGKKSKAEDIVLLFFAGHGVMSGTDKKEFTLLTAEASKYNEIGVSTSDLKEWLSPTGPNKLLAQKRILIFDACNSGQANKDLLVLARTDDETRRLRQIEDLKDKSGVFILSASAPDQVAYEFPQFEQGLLTYAMLKTLKQNSEVLEEGGFLNVSRWFSVVEDEVQNLAREQNRKQNAQPFGSGDITIGRVDDEVRAAIQLVNEKPVIVAANFRDTATGLDNKLFNRLINNRLSHIASRGNKSSVTFMESNPVGYKMIGLSSEQEGILTCKVNILKNAQPVHSFEIQGSSDELETLAQDIIEQAVEWIGEHYNN